MGRFRGGASQALTEAASVNYMGRRDSASIARNHWPFAHLRAVAVNSQSVPSDRRRNAMDYGLAYSLISTSPKCVMRACPGRLSVLRLDGDKPSVLAER